MPDLDHLLPSIAAGDPDAFGRWVAGAEFRLRASLGSFAARLDLEPIVQETLLRVWQVAPRVELDGRGDSLLRLAIRIGRNLAVSELRRCRVAPIDPETLDASLSEDALTRDATPDPLLRQLIDLCRQKLPRRPAQALAARLESQGRSCDGDLADALGMRPNTFLQNVTRARRLLAECLERGGVNLQEVHR